MDPDDTFYDDKSFWDKNGFFKDFNKLSSKQKSDILKSAIKYYDKDYKQTIQKYNKIINNIKSTPINKKSYAEALHSENMIRGVSTVAGATIGMAVLIAIAGASGKSVVGAAIVGGMFGLPIGSIAGFSIVPNMTKKYEKKL